MILYLALITLVNGELAHGAGKHPPTIDATNWVGKKVIALAPVRDVNILLPDNSVHNFGQAFQARLTSLLSQSGKYTVVDVPDSPRADRASGALSSGVLGSATESPGAVSAESVESYNYVWVGSEMPSVIARVTVEALTFQTGALGDRMFYGFDERLNNSFNNTRGTPKNEFPLRNFSNQSSWFGDSFDEKGIAPFDSRSGLDLGEGLSLDFLYAFLNLKYSGYHADLHLRLELESPLRGLNSKLNWNGVQNKNYELIEVKGDGFFFDLVGGYGNYTAGISLARKDAMNQALQAAINASYAALDRALSAAPWLAKVDVIIRDGWVLMGTGPMANIKVGTQYESLQHPGLVIQVFESNANGSSCHVIYGDSNLLSLGMVFQEINSVPKGSNLLFSNTSSHSVLARNSMPMAPAVVDSIQLPSNNFSPTDLKGVVQLVTRIEAFFKSLVGVLFLPYRIWRYFAYDQSYHSHADLGGPSRSDLAQESWRRQIGLDQVGAVAVSNGPAPVVAVIDSGVDYNHAVLHDALWLNPLAMTDVEGRKDRYGWDFISNDSKPYDDSYHGTQVASLVVSVAPAAKVLPLKVFNPWGITTSAAVYAAFVYAVDHGAQVILCAWATNISSEAVEHGVAYAKQHGVIVVAAAGDQGLDLSKFPAYPAVLSQTYDNVVTVTDVDFNDRLVQAQGKKPNYDLKGSFIQLAAPGETLWVAEPRGGKSVETSTGLAAAIVAGVLARNLAGIGSKYNNYSDWIAQLLQDAVQLDQLRGQVRGGRRVRVAR